MAPYLLCINLGLKEKLVPIENPPKTIPTGPLT